MPDAEGNVKGIRVPDVPWHKWTVNQRKLIDKLLRRRPLARMQLQAKLNKGLSSKEASDLIDQLRRS